jgi:hypothetical protein
LRAFEGFGVVGHDSAYRLLVTARYMCAGFVVQGGRVTLCAPILRWSAVIVDSRNLAGTAGE